MVLLEIRTVRVVGSVLALDWAVCSIRRCWMAMIDHPDGQRCLDALMCFSSSFLELGRVWELNTQVTTPPAPLGDVEVLGWTIRVCFLLSAFLGCCSFPPGSSFPIPPCQAASSETLLEGATPTNISALAGSSKITMTESKTLTISPLTIFPFLGSSR